MEILVVLLIALIVFGPKRLPELGRSLGDGIRGFKHALDGSEESPAAETEKTPAREEQLPPSKPAAADGDG